MEEELKKLIIHFLEIERGKKGMHLPGYNYCGPGTPIVSSVLKNVLPINFLDSACQVHDIEYMQYAGNEELLRKSDQKLIDASKSWYKNEKNLFTKFYNWIASKGVNLVFSGKKILEDLKLIDTVKFTEKLASLDILSENKVGIFLKELLDDIQEEKNKKVNLFQKYL